MEVGIQDVVECFEEGREEDLPAVAAGEFILAGLGAVPGQVTVLTTDTTLVDGNRFGLFALLRAAFARMPQLCRPRLAAPPINSSAREG